MSRILWNHGTLSVCREPPAIALTAATSARRQTHVQSARQHLVRT
jgi:hypothetical protein